MIESAQQLIADLETRDVRLWADGDRLILDAPKGALTPQEVERIRAAKTALLVALHPPARTAPTADAMIDELRDTLRRIEMIAEGGSPAARERIGDLLAEFGPVIELLMLRADSRALRCALVDLERNCRDAASGRGRQ